MTEIADVKNNVKDAASMRPRLIAVDD